jgi:hypothetical protein
MQGSVIEGMTVRRVALDVIALATHEDALEFDYDGEEGWRVSMEYVQREIPQEDDNPYEWLLGVQVRSNMQEFEEPEAITIQELSAARMNFSYTNEGVTVDGFRLYVWLPEGFELTVEAVAYDPARYAELEKAVFDLLETVNLTASGADIAPDGWSTYFEENCRWRFNYPTDWLMVGLNNQLMLFNSADAQDSHLRRRFDEGDELAIEMITPLEVTRFFMDTIDVDVATADEILMAYAALEQLSLLSDPELVETGGNVALRAEILNGIVLVYPFGDGEFFIFAAQTGAEGFADFEADVLAIAESIAYQSPDADIEG